MIIGGHAGDFDPAVNFLPIYLYYHPIPNMQVWMILIKDDFSLALYSIIAGETDNHGFQPRRIGCRVEDNDTVSMGRVMGINRQGDQEVRT